jgi:hypothetical protein
MKIRLGKAFLEECRQRGYFTFKPDADERGTVMFDVLDRSTETKTGLSVDVTPLELGHLISECDWFVYNNSPDGSSDDRQNYNNLRNQLKALRKVKSFIMEYKYY